MKTTRKILLAMLLLVTVMAFGVSAYAAGEDVSDADAITIDSIIFSEYTGEGGTVDETLLKATVGFTAVYPEQVTILLTTENLTEITDANKAKVIYIDQLDNPSLNEDNGTFEFVIEKARVATAIGQETIDGCTLYAKMGGTDLDTMASQTIVLEDPSVADFMPGDVDGDEDVTSYDALLVLRYEAGWDLTDIIEAAMDVDGDDEATSFDAVLMLRYEAGWDIEFE